MERKEAPPISHRTEFPRDRLLPTGRRHDGGAVVPRPRSRLARAHVREELVHLVLAVVAGEERREDGDHLSSAGVRGLYGGYGAEETRRGFRRGVGTEARWTGREWRDEGGVGRGGWGGVVVPVIGIGWLLEVALRRLTTWRSGLVEIPEEV